MNDCRHTILCVDDEINIINSIKRLLRKENYQILTASSGAEALKVLEQNQVHLIISDQRMPEMSGTELLGIVKERYPEAIRTILSGFIDVDAIAESVNKGHIYKFFLKPWEDQTLKLEIQKALEQYDLQQANKELHRQVQEQNEELKKINENLETLVQERAKELIIQNQTLELSRAILDDLPVAIIGVGADGVISLINQEAQKFSFNGQGIIVGEEVGNYFEDSVAEKISMALGTNTTQILNSYRLSGMSYKVHFTPLSGSFRGTGVILTLRAFTDSQGTSNQV